MKHNAITPEQAKSLAERMVEIANDNGFFYEYDEDFNTGEYEGMPFPAYAEKLKEKITNAILKHGLDPQKIFDETAYDWLADGDGETDGYCTIEDEVMGYVTSIIKKS